jgi:hypothetical protein
MLGSLLSAIVGWAVLRCGSGPAGRSEAGGSRS